MKLCKDVMTKTLICCVPDDSVMKAAEWMKRENIGPVLVVDTDQKLVGIVTDRDLALKVVAEGRDPQSTKIEAVMSRHVLTCHPEDNVAKALRAMAEHQIRRIPVVDKDSKVVGIIAQADIATRVNQPEETAEVVKEISQSNGTHTGK